MNKYIYLYQLENYETLRFLKGVYRSFFKKSKVRKIEFERDLKTKFILFFSIFIFLVISLLLLFLTPIYISAPIMALLWLLRFFLLIISEKLFLRYENRQNKKEFDAAKQKVRAFDEVVFVGIAGSSGKSSLLAILTELLGEKTATTIGTKDGLVGLVQSINQKLTLGLKQFICEMNANKPGQIKAMCVLTQPKIGILTNINEQHLERYKNIENTVSSKFELLQSLTEDGVGIVNLDNQLVRENLGKASAEKLIGYTLDGNSSQLCQKTVLVTAYEVLDYGSRFALNIAGEEYNFSTTLIGKNHLSNVVAAVICAVELGQKPEHLVEKVSNLKQIPHKLEQKIRNNIYILDNTGGSNVESFRNSLEILKMHPRKKVLVTPGIYEVGEKSNEVHKMLGYMTSGVADLIVLLGESHRTENIRAGALDHGFDKNRIIRVRDLDEVYRFVDKNLNEGDVVLLENDLDDRFV